VIGEWMKRGVVSVRPETTVLEAARLIVQRHVGTLPVVDEQQALIGIVRVEEILDTFMPDFVRLMADFDFVHNFGVLEALQPADVPEVAGRTMRDMMHEPVSVEQTSGLLRALAVMTKHGIRDLPVVNQAGALVGIASLVDISTAFLSSWTKEGTGR
jgi:CBS-domain-containing membrane protein